MATAKRQSKGYWIMAGTGNYPAICTRCGDSLHLPLPQPIEVFLAASNAFMKIHLECVSDSEGK